MGKNVSMSKRADDRNDKNSMGITADCDIAEDTAKQSEAQAGAQEEARAAKQASASAQAAAVYWTPEQAEAVDCEKIVRLFQGPFGKRILNAQEPKREFKFSILTDAGAYDPAAAGEQVMLQGVVDCFWEEADGIVLVDFKTDRTPDGPQACAARYCAQLNAYAKALTRIYGAPVKEKILYFFSCDCAYHLD